MVATDDKPVVYCASAEEWRAWLAQHHADSDGVRLQLRKKASTLVGIMYPDALDEALCFGWIDGQTVSLDGDFFLQVFTPRRPRSVWSQINREHVGRLAAEGRMTSAGLAEVERAKADGRWHTAYRQRDAEIPPDLLAALDASAAAADFFAALSSQNRFAILFRISNVKRAATRAAKIATFVAMLERGETLYPQRRPQPHDEVDGVDPTAV